MNKFEKQQLEKKVSEIMGCEVEIVTGRTVLPMHQDKPSIDMQLLEMENKQRLSLEKSLAMKEQRKQNSLVNRFKKKVDSIAKGSVDLLDHLCEELPTVVEELPSKLLKIKVVDAINDYFFGYGYEDEEEEYEIIGHYNHTKRDVVEEENVIYLSRDFKDLKKVDQ